jgi:transposase
VGHTIRLIPPQYVKPFVKRGKNDRNDAEAICEAASRPTMPVVPVKSAQTQADAMDLSARDLLVRQRTQLVNAVRGHAAEFGIIAAKGITQVEPLLDKIAEADMPQAAKETLAQLGRCIAQLDAQLAEIDQRLTKQHKSNPVSQRLAAVPGVGPITALTMAVKVDPGQFQSGRHFAAWLGLTPKEQSTGGRQCLGGISRAGDERLRQLLVLGATTVIRHAKPGSKTASPWLLKLLERRPRKVAAVALANKMARIVWSMMTNDTAYRQAPQAA